MELLGEFEIELGGKKYKLKPSFEGAVLIEEKSCKSIADLLNNFKKIGIKDISAIIYGGMYGANNREIMTYEQIGNLVLKEGYLKFVGVWVLLGAIYTGKPVNDFIESLEEKKDPSKIEEKKS